MTERQRMSDTLEIRGSGAERSVCCSACGHRLAQSGKPWKPGALLNAVPMQEGAGPSHATIGDAELRRFLCPGCGALLDTETASKDDPFLNDVLYV